MRDIGAWQGGCRVGFPLFLDCVWVGKEGKQGEVVVNALRPATLHVMWKESIEEYVDGVWAGIAKCSRGVRWRCIATKVWCME